MDQRLGQLPGGGWISAAVLLIAAARPGTVCGAGSSPPPNAVTSASYCILPAGASSGGGVLVNGGGTAVRVDAILGDSVLQGISVPTGSGYAQVPGFTGQANEVASIAVNSMPTTVDEGASRQLEAIATMDDSTTTALLATDVSWGVVGGPVTGVDANGLASAGAVFENTAATVEGDYLSFNDQHGLTVLDVDPDNYLSYGSDGIDDDWQVNFFGGPPNADAGPGQNPDGDIADNLFEFLSGFDPTDSTQFFQLTHDGFSGASTFDLRLNKIIAGRTYRIYEDAALGGFGSLVGTLNPVGEENDKLFQDTGASGTENYYRVEISKP